MSGILSIREYRPGMFRAVQLVRHIQKPLDDCPVCVEESAPYDGIPSSVEVDMDRVRVVHLNR